MFDKLRKRPVLLVILIVLCLVILFAIFSPRNGNIAGLNVNANLGNLRGGFKIEAFENSTNPTLALFYAPWCGHCKRFEPIYNKFQQSYQGPASVTSINCDENKEMAQMHGIKGFPTLRFFPNGMSDASNFMEYNGERTLEGLTNYMNQNVPGTQAVAPDNAAPVQ